VHDPAANGTGADEPAPPVAQESEPLPAAPLAAVPQDTPPADDAEALADLPDDERSDDTSEEGPVHRPLIRATLPRQEGQAPPARPAPDFTIRQPAGGRPNRFRQRNQRGGAMFPGNRGTGTVPGSSRNGAQRFSGNGNHPPQGGGPGRRGNQQRQNRKRFK